jgi:urease accessory protein
MKTFKDPHQILQVWFSSSFPIGSYAYSHGLEALIDDKKIKNKDDIKEFLDALLFYGTLRNDYIFMKSIYKGEEINELILASASSKERKIEMIDMGNSFRKIMKDSWELSLPENTSFIYSLAKAGLHFDIKFDDLIKFYLQSFISNLINVCVKHIPMSQKDGQSLNVIYIDQIQEFLTYSDKLTLKDIGTTFFIGDIFAIKHENLDSRIYLT